MEYVCTNDFIGITSSYMILFLFFLDLLKYKHRYKSILI